MEKSDIRTFEFKTPEDAAAAIEKIAGKFPQVKAHILKKNQKKISTTQPESLTSMLCDYIKEELGGVQKGFSLSWG